MKALTKTQQDNAISTMRKLLNKTKKGCTEIIEIALDELFSMSFEHSAEEKLERLEEFQVIMDQLLIEA